VPHDGRRRRHQDRPEPRLGGLDDRLDLVASLLLQLVGELDDQDSVLRDQSDERDESDLARC